MHITALAWDDENVEHIAKHRVQPAEVEEVCFGPKNVLLRAQEGRYAVLGQTEAGRYLKVIITFPIKGRSRVITARDMTSNERRYYTKLKKGRD